jgi:hypothetical protein
MVLCRAYKQPNGAAPGMQRRWNTHSILERDANLPHGAVLKVNKAP